MGSDGFSMPILRSLLDGGHTLPDPVLVMAVVTQPDRPSGRGRRLVASPVGDLAKERGVAVMQPVRLRHADSVRAIQDLSPDLVIVASYGQILPRAVLEIPRLGAVNLHPSLLPKYRGPSPVASAILQGEVETGVTLMEMAVKMDAGPLIGMQSTVIDPEETGGELTDRLAVESGKLLMRLLPSWLQGTLRATPQDDAMATYSPLLSKEDGQLNWNLPAADLVRRVRAFNPWPMTFTWWGDRQVRILVAHAISGKGEPGICDVSGEGNLVVGTGRGLLVVDVLQLAGRKSMSAPEMMRGHPDLANCHFQSRRP